MTSAWLAASFVLCAGLVPCALLALRAENPFDRLVALEMASTLVSLALVTLAEAMQRPLFLDLALTQALLSFGGGLVFARVLERWL
jgi:multisubunit Na+/H+ antiporter MnhF subunit